MTTYEQASEQFVLAWNAGQEAAKSASENLVNMLMALKEQGYVQSAAINKIALDHQHLKGCSLRSLYRNLPIELKREYKPALPKTKVSRENLNEQNTNIDDNTGTCKLPNDNFNEQNTNIEDLSTLRQEYGTLKQEIESLRSQKLKVQLDVTKYWGKLFAAKQNGVNVVLHIENSIVIAVYGANEQY